MNFIKIAGSDIKGIFKNRFIRVSVIAIIIVPLLYSLLYLDAFWDPYGRLKDMPVAVVNLDHGANVDGNYQSYGQEFVDKLKDDDRVGWKFVSEEDANEGLEGNKYYAKLVITEDFSKDVASAKEGAPKQASLKFVCNEKKNFLASQVNSKVESALKEEITKSVTDTYVTGAFDNLYKVKDGMGQAADGSGQINDGLTTLNGKVPELADGTNKLNDGSNQLYDGQVALNNGISQLNSKVPALVDGTNKLNNGSNQLYNGQVALNNGISQLNGGLGTLNNRIGPLNDGLALLNSQVSEFSQVKDLNEGMCKLNTGLSKLNDKTPELVSSIGLLNGGLTSLYNAYNNQVYPKITDINSKIDEIQVILSKMKTEPKTKNTEATDKGNLDSNLKDKVKNAENLLSNGKNNEALNALKEILTSDSNKSNDSSNSDKSNSDQLTELSTKVNDLKLQSYILNCVLNNPDPQKPGFAIAFKKVCDGSTNLNNSVTGDKDNPSLIKSVSDMYKGSNDLLAGTNKLNEKAPALITGVPQLYSGSNEAVEGIKKLYLGSNDALVGSKKLVSGQGDFKDGISTLSGKVPALETGVTKLYDGSNKLVSGQGDLKDGITTLNGKVPELKDGVTKLHDGSNELATKLKDGSNELSDGLVNTSQDMGTFVATPVNLEVAPINPVPNYGSGFSPYFINLSLWIGAIMMFFVISAKTEQYEGATKFDKAFGKFLSFGFVGILQAVLVGIVVLTLGLSPANMPLYFASLIFFSLVYIAIVQCLISLFGDAGRLLSIVLLILQLTACAGTFPLELVPRFFVVINPFMPFTYSVDALREICSASVINYGVLCKDYIILAIVLVVFLTISIAGATFGEKMQRVIEGRKSGMN